MSINQLRHTVQLYLAWRRVERDAVDSPADFWRGLWFALLIGAALLFVVGLALGPAWYGLVAGAAVAGVGAYAGLMYCGGVN